MEALLLHVALPLGGVEDLLEKVIKMNEKLVVFSYTIPPLEILKQKIDMNFGSSVSLIYKGDMSNNERKSTLSKFKKEKEVVALLCSGKVAGEGLNLTEANNVVFVNEWWNPSSNKQAQDRVLRIGQSKEVNIFHLRSKGTVEERIDQILDTKTNLTIEVIEAMVKEEAS